VNARTERQRRGRGVWRSPPLLFAAGAVAVCGSAVAGSARSEQPGALASAGGVSRVQFGHSVKGRALTALRMGKIGSGRVALVVGVTHGDERAGLRVTRRLRRRYRHMKGAELWVVDALNLDGLKAGTRKNARGVDLNRNFSYRWQGGVPRSSGYYPGPRPFSEPETRAARRLIEKIRPDVSIWYHQPWGGVLACRGRPRIAYRYAKLARLGTSCQGLGLSGTAIGWQKHRFGKPAFVVEFGHGSIAPATAGRHARAAAIVARGRREGSTAAARAGDPSAEASAVTRPAIRKWRIPYGRKRKRDMARYSKRHYGRFRWELRNHLHVVEHVAVAGSVRAVWNTFAPNRPDPEYGELPGVCSHFVIGPRGGIYKLVPTSIRCRHVVGLNHLSIGIEHVGYSDGEVMGRRRQLRASLRLSRWLRCRFGLGVKRVIGHAESLSSPFYKELVPRFRGRTHSDFKHRTMRKYRRKLRRLGDC
jgi:N-acetylmuramoyl-L-alanine amidase